VRSSTRNCPLLFSTLQIIFASGLLGDDYLIGYRLTIANSTLHNETLSISKAMIPCKGHSTSTVRLQRTSSESLKTTIQNNEEEFLHFAMQQSMHLKSNTLISSHFQDSQDTLTLPVQCYAVEFNEDFATITLLQ
jgi:hypothetical protein